MAHPSPFAALEATFGLLSQQPYAVAIDGRRLGHGAPARSIPISELRSIALHPAASHDLRDRVLDAVIAGLQEERATWTVVLGGIRVSIASPTVRLHTACRSDPKRSRSKWYSRLIGMADTTESLS